MTLCFSIAILCGTHFVRFSRENGCKDYDETFSSILYMWETYVSYLELSYVFWGKKWLWTFFVRLPWENGRTDYDKNIFSILYTLREKVYRFFGTVLRLKEKNCGRSRPALLRF